LTMSANPVPTLRKDGVQKKSRNCHHCTCAQGVLSTNKYRTTNNGPIAFKRLPAQNLATGKLSQNRHIEVRWAEAEYKGKKKKKEEIGARSPMLVENRAGKRSGRPMA